MAGAILASVQSPSQRVSGGPNDRRIPLSESDDEILSSRRMPARWTAQLRSIPLSTSKWPIFVAFPGGCCAAFPTLVSLKSSQHAAAVNWYMIELSQCEDHFHLAPPSSTETAGFSVRKPSRSCRTSYPRRPSIRTGTSPKRCARWRRRKTTIGSPYRNRLFTLQMRRPLTVDPRQRDPLFRHQGAAVTRSTM